MAEAVGANLVGMEWIQMVTFSDAAITAAIENSIQVNQAGERFVRKTGAGMNCVKLYWSRKAVTVTESMMPTPSSTS